MNLKKRKNDNVYYDPIKFNNVFATWKIVRGTCKNRKAVFNFSLNKNTNSYAIYTVLKEKRYRPLPFRLFLIFEPKARLVMSQTVSDKIVNHFVTNYYLLPILEKKLIDQNVATRKNKGSEYANKLIINYINSIRIKDTAKEIYCLKVDISKYFYSINHEILISKLEKTISDKDVINIIKVIIDETNKSYVNETIKKYNEKYNTTIPLYEYGTGLSIGAMTSQFLAIFFLNDLDHYIKEKLKCRYYIRYMDDFLIFDTDRNKLKIVWKEIQVELKKIKLTMNPKSGIHKLTTGITFLGYSYKIINNKFKISYRKKTYQKITKKLNALKAKNIVQYYKSYASYYGYLNKVVKHERKFKMKAIEKHNFYKEKYPNHIIFVKVGSFYKTYEDDAIIMWHFFDYKWNDGSIAFGASPYSKVLDKLNQLEISYVVILNNDECQLINNDSENYDLYLKIAKKRYKKFTEKNELYSLFKDVVDTNPNRYEELKELLNNFGGNRNE